MKREIIATRSRQADDSRGEAFVLDLLCVGIALCFFVDSALLVRWSDRVR